MIDNFIFISVVETSSGWKRFYYRSFDYMVLDANNDISFLLMHFGFKVSSITGLAVSSLRDNLVVGDKIPDFWIDSYLYIGGSDCYIFDSEPQFAYYFFSCGHLCHVWTDSNRRLARRVLFVFEYPSLKLVAYKCLNDASVDMMDSPVLARILLASRDLL